VVVNSAALYKSRSVLETLLTEEGIPVDQGGIEGSSGNNERLRVSEIFTSLQGEGPYSGTPAVFLRLAFCNMHCWYCDTKYTWLFHEKLLRRVISDTKGSGVIPPPDLIVYDKEREVKEMALGDIASELLKSNQRHLVVTGGEPMLQQSALIPLITRLKEKSGRNYFVEVETSGTVKPFLEMQLLIDEWNVSPKLESSGNTSARERPEVLRLFANLPDAIFKFVVQSSEDLREIKSLVERYSIPSARVMLMPEGTDPQILKERSAWLLKVCNETGYRFSSRLHILMWGNKRGV